MLNKPEETKIILIDSDDVEINGSQRDRARHSPLPNNAENFLIEHLSYLIFYLKTFFEFAFCLLFYLIDNYLKLEFELFVAQTSLKGFKDFLIWNIESLSIRF